MRGNFLLYTLVIVILLAAAFVAGMFMYVFVVPSQRMAITITNKTMAPLEQKVVEELNEMNALDTAAGQGALELLNSNKSFYGKATSTMQDQQGVLSIAGWLIFIGSLIFILSVTEIKVRK